MPPLIRRFRRPKAELRLDWDESTPPEQCSGGVVRWQVRLLPLEPFRISGGRLELALLTTRFSRTALDGYHEHTAGQVFHTAVLCDKAAAHPGQTLLYTVALPLPHAPPPADSRPMRRQWQARARFEADGYRQLRATRILPDATPPRNGAPVVDGRWFLPLHGFRPDANR